MTAAKLAALLAFALLLPPIGEAAEDTEAPEEIIVVGRLPGPPLWKVSSGDKVLWMTWLDAAENGLAMNASTLAILPINELLAEDGLLSKLKAKGYDVREP